jgi:Domain of unknown function (DUF4166)
MTEISGFESTPAGTCLATGNDDRFRHLLSPTDWAALPTTVQERFSRHVRPGRMRVFAGYVSHTHHSRFGLFVAHLARLIGAPLPHAREATGPSTVIVTESASLGGQVWTRTYTRADGFPQTINSVKRFAGPTHLEEYLGAGLVMRLRLRVEDGLLVFESAGYDLLALGRRIPLPRILSPGRCTIIHRDDGHGRFTFELTLGHPRLGRLVHQIAHFEEVAS